MTSAELDRKVRQLDNDVHAIYRMLGEISETQGKHGEALADVKDSLSSVRGTQARHGNRLRHCERQITEGVFLEKGTEKYTIGTEVGCKCVMFGN